ncbi:MAG: AAA family ATPase [Fusobacteriaceae bacterium]
MNMEDMNVEEVSVEDKEIGVIAKQRAKEFCKKHKITGTSSIVKYAKLKMAEKGIDTKWELSLMRNPYVLMNLEGVGFNRADAVAMKLNFPFDHEYRILAFVSKSLDDLSKGSTIISMSEVLVYISSKLGITNAGRLVKIVLNKTDGKFKLLDGNYKRTKVMKDARYLTRTTWIESESGFYKLLRAVDKQHKLCVDKSIVDKVKASFPYTLNEGQSSAVDNILSNNINVLTGLGGTGKSSITKAILQVLTKHKQKFTCLAPTGIASKNFSRLTGYKCETIHRKAYSKNKDIVTDWLVIEEASMLADDHIALLLDMLKDNKPKLLFIGDMNQLTPISAGAPFRDLFSLIQGKKVNGNVIELTEIMRASNDLFIPHLCKMFTKYGNYDSSVEYSNHKGVEFRDLEKDTAKQVLGIAQQYGFNFKNTYVLSPQNVGTYGCNAINEVINNVVADSVILYRDKFKTYRIGSELLHKENNKSMKMFNGERLTLMSKEQIGGSTKYICKKLDEDMTVEYDEETLCNQTQLSYGLTVHKTQSITAENVIFIATKEHRHMLTSNLIYTAMSRASKNLVILHDRGALGLGSKKKEIDKRITFLGELSKR